MMPFEMIVFLIVSAYAVASFVWGVCYAHRGWQDD